MHSKPIAISSDTIAPPNEIKCFVKKNLVAVSLTTVEKKNKFSKENRLKVCELCLYREFIKLKKETDFQVI